MKLAGGIRKIKYFIPLILLAVFLVYSLIPGFYFSYAESYMDEGDIIRLQNKSLLGQLLDTFGATCSMLGEWEEHSFSQQNFIRDSLVSSGISLLAIMLFAAEATAYALLGRYLSSIAPDDKKGRARAETRLELFCPRRFVPFSGVLLLIPAVFVHLLEWFYTHDLLYYAFVTYILPAPIWIILPAAILQAVAILRAE